MKKELLSTLCIILFFSSCQNKNEDDSEWNKNYSKDELLLKAKNDYAFLFSDLEYYNNVYSNPLWDETDKIINHDEEATSYYTPLDHNNEYANSYLISTVEHNNNNVSYFILNMPKKYTSIYDYIAHNEGQLFIRQDTANIAVAFVPSKLQDVKTKQRNDGSLMINLDSEGKGGSSPLNGGSFGEVVIWGQSEKKKNSEISTPLSGNSYINFTPPPIYINNNTNGGGSTGNGSSNKGPLNQQDYYEIGTPGLNHIMLEPTKDIADQTIVYPINQNKDKEEKRVYTNPKVTEGFPFAQNGAYCIISSMAYIKANYYNQGTFSGNLINYIKEITNNGKEEYIKYFTDKGLPTADALSLLDKEFGNSKLTQKQICQQYKQIIDKGQPIILVYRPNPMVDAGHAVVVIG